MYHVKHAYGHTGARLSAWEPISEPERLTGILAMQYREMWLILTHDDLPHELALNFESIQDQLGMTQTLSEFLVANEDRALPTQAQLPYIKTGSLLYEDAYRARFTVGIVNEFTSQTHAIYDDNHWVTLERQDLDTKKAYEHCLVSINGFIHPTDYDVNKLYVQGAVESSLISERAEVGIYSFEQIGKLVFVPITDDILSRDVDVALKERTIFKTELDLTRYTPAISLGGYLHVADPRVLRSVGDGLLQLDWSSVPLVKRYYESKEYINLESIVLDRHSENAELLNVEQLYSDENLHAYLTLKQSFLIFIDNNQLSKEHLSIERGPTWDRYLGYERHRLPMLSNTGKLVEYWKIEEEGVQSYFTPRSSQLNYLHRRSDPKRKPNIDPTLIGAFPGRPEDKGHSVFLKLTSSKLLFA